MLGGASGEERVTLEIKLSDEEVLRIGLPAKNARLIAFAMLAQADAIDAQESHSLRA
jgi:hypothetical protein